MKFRDTKTGKIWEANDPNDLPAGTYVQVNGSMPTSAGCTCIPCASGAGIQSVPQTVSGQGMRVDSQAICELPPAEPINASFTPCLKPIYVDCNFALWTTDPYSGSVYCRPGDTGWQVAKLDRCPEIKSKLYVDDSGATPVFWALVDNAYFRYEQVQGTYQWVQYNGPIPTCLYPVFWNAATGDYVYYAAVTEMGQRQTLTITNMNLCTGTA